MTLIERIEAAECGSRELDVAIWLAAVADKKSRKAYDEGLAISPEEAAFRADYMMDGQRYSTSLDAAMSLVHAPPPDVCAGAYMNVEAWDDNGVYPAHVRATAWIFGAKRVYAATPALALCAAALKAKDTSHDG